MHDPKLPHHDGEPGVSTAAATAARSALQRAYLLVGFGRFDEAIAACDEAGELLPDHPLAPALKGAFMLARGQALEAMQHLARVQRRFPDDPMTRLHYCEALFFAGRSQRAWKELDALERTLVHDEPNSPWLEFARGLRACWQDVPAGTLPAPLVVPVD